MMSGSGSGGGVGGGGEGVFFEKNSGGCLKNSGRLQAC